ncbi:MAG: hypothetical protein IJS88_05355 [Alphaproteobacteria bacterium]|nr:hypothetical protein [Alphaproteobacteria bacterium]
MEKKIITGTIVTLVTYPESLSVIDIPHHGEYNNPRIVKLTPCIKHGSKYFDLRTKREVFRTESSVEWLNLSGTVFRYPDGHNVLVSKKLDGSGYFVAEEIAEHGITSNMMPRRIFDRSKEKSA